MYEGNPVDLQMEKVISADGIFDDTTRACRVYSTRKEPQVLSCSSSLRSFMPFMGFLICVSLPGGLRRYYKIHSQCGTLRD